MGNLNVTKAKLFTVGTGIVLMVAGIIGGYFAGVSSGEKVGHNRGYGIGYDEGRHAGYEDGYKVGFDNGKEYVVTHIDEYVKVPKAVKYEEVVAFLKDDKTDLNSYSDEYNCDDFTRNVRQVAIEENIKCGFVSLEMYDTVKKEYEGHAINAFETIDKGIVYFDPQTDEPRYNIKVGEYYNDTKYLITKVDIIW